MLHSILVPLDGSSYAEQAIPYAFNLAASASSMVVLLHVATGRSSDSDTGTAQSSEPDPALEAAHSYVSTLSQRYVATGKRATTVFRNGNPTGEIIAEVNEALADLVVMSAFGHSGPGKKVMGSIPYLLLHRLHVPLLLIDPQQPATSGRILIVLDGAAHASGTLPAYEHVPAILDYVHNFAGASGSSVTLMQTSYPKDSALSALDPSATSEEIQLYNERLPRIIEEDLNEVARSVHELNIETEIVCAGGEVTTAINDHLKRKPVDLVVVAAQRHSTYSSKLVDRLVQTILNSYHLPALIYPIHPHISLPYRQATFSHV